MLTPLALINTATLLSMLFHGGQAGTAFTLTVDLSSSAMLPKNTSKFDLFSLRNISSFETFFGRSDALSAGLGQTFGPT
jgi:hypothetical protein